MSPSVFFVYQYFNLLRVLKLLLTLKHKTLEQQVMLLVDIKVMCINFVEQISASAVAVS